jgi:hypothetical protein
MAEPYDKQATRDLARSLLDDDEPWFVAPIRDPWYIALARAIPDPQVEHPLAAIQAVLDDYGLQVVPKTPGDLVAALDRICWDIDGDDPVEIARAALSAEAGDPKVKDASHGRESDTGNWMGGGLEITYLSAEAGDTDD